VAAADVPAAGGALRPLRAVLAAEVLSTTGTAMLGVAAVSTLAATSFLLATRAA
jgi:hypothetical protein